MLGKINIRDVNGKKIVEINKIEFSSKRKIDWESRDSIKSFGTIGKAKANAAQAIPELIRSLSDIKHFTNFDDKHTSDAPNGWYRGTVHFSLPTTDDRGRVIGRNTFRGRMVIRCDSQNKLLLYDIVTIKKET